MPVEVRRSRGKWDGQEVLVFVARDISDSLRAERAAKEGEANFRAVFESITDLIYVGNQEGRILYCNQAVIQKLGYSQQELANMHILDLHQKERREEAETILSAMFEGKQDQCPLPLVRRDGSILSVQTRCWFGQWGGRECVFGISKDMTEEQEAQQRFEGMFRKNPTPMALSEFGNCRFFDVNDAFTRQLGYSRSEIIGRTSRELGLFLCPEEHEHLREEVRRMMSISDRELQVRCKDGTVLDGLFSGQIIASQEKKFFLTVMVDITARNRANGEILRTKELLSLATRAGGVGIWDYRAEDESVKWDAQMFKLYGIDEKDFSGKNMDFVARVIPEDRPRVVEEIQAALAGTKEFNTEFRIRWPDGSVHHIRAIAEVQLDESGRPMRVVGTNWDVTARNEIRRTVDNQTSLIDSLLRSIADIVFYKDLDGVYLGCNPAFADFVGKPEDKIIGKTDYDLFSQEIADSFRENDWQMMRHCAPRKNDEWITYPNGKRRFVETMKSPYWGPDGKIIGILGISRDITNRK
jgi:PAS domain S-box-containing protein